jgi:hypothetical protein
VSQLMMERRAPARVPAGPGGTASHARRASAAVSLAVLGVLLLAAWSLTQGWGRGPVAGPGELVVDSGLARVDGVVSAARPQHAMPGMGTDEDPVAEGDRRISVDVTLQAGTGTVRFAADRFGLLVDGEPADHLAHRDVLPGDTLPAGTQLSGTLLFDVPVDATTATLIYDGAGAVDVVLPPEQEQGTGAAPTGGTDATDDPMTGAGHGGDGHTDAPGADR